MFKEKCNWTNCHVREVQYYSRMTNDECVSQFVAITKCKCIKNQIKRL